MTAAAILHNWTRAAEATFPNPGKIATEQFTTDHDWATEKPIDDTLLRKEAN